MRISDWSSDVCSSDLAGNDHPLPVEGHGLAHLGHPGIAHHLLVRGVARGAVGIFEPAEDDLLAFLCLYRGTEIVELARGDLVAPRLDVAAHPELLDQRRGVGRLLPTFRSETRRVGKELG